MPRLPDRLHDLGDHLRFAEVFVRLIEDHQTIEWGTFAASPREDPHEDDEQDERFVLLDPLISKVDDHGAARAEEAREVSLVGYVFVREGETVLDQSPRGRAEVRRLKVGSHAL